VRPVCARIQGAAFSVEEFGLSHLRIVVGWTTLELRLVHKSQVKPAAPARASPRHLPHPLASSAYEVPLVCTWQSGLVGRCGVHQERSSLQLCQHAHHNCNVRETNHTLHSRATVSLSATGLQSVCSTPEPQSASLPQACSRCARTFWPRPRPTNPSRTKSWPALLWASIVHI
jgi:hypothetical protein